MLFWGGESPALLADGARYNPTANTWTAMSAGPLAARRYQSIVWTGTEAVIWGGQITAGFTNTGAA